MRTFYAIVKDDPLDTGGRVIEGGNCCSIAGEDGRQRQMAFLGQQAWCETCKSSGTITAAPGSPGSRRMMDLTGSGRHQALEGDLVLCKCARHPRLVAVHGRSWKVQGEHAGYPNVGAVSAGGALEEALAVSGAAPRPSAAPTEQATQDCSYLDGSKGRIDAPAEFYKRSNAVTVGPGTATTFDFPGGGSGKATQYEATVNGRPISVYVTDSKPAPGYGIPTHVEITKALETVPTQQYGDLKKVMINSEPNPEDAIWQKKFGDPSFSSAATASLKQGVAIYPWKGWSTFPQRYIDSTMLHETGHIWSETLWQDTVKKQEWLEAIAKDGGTPSNYAKNNPTEDFAETANMYWSSKGTPCEKAGRDRYPARYAYFDKITR